MFKAPAADRLPIDVPCLTGMHSSLQSLFSFPNRQIDWWDSAACRLPNLATGWNRGTNKRTDAYGDCAYFSIPSGGERSVNAVWTYESPYEAVAQIKDHLAFYQDRVDAIEVRAP
jgi:hypothetical protein